jgi:hypothetical protein
MQRIGYGTSCLQQLQKLLQTHFGAMRQDVTHSVICRIQTSEFKSVLVQKMSELLAKPGKNMIV